MGTSLVTPPTVWPLDTPEGHRAATCCSGPCPQGACLGRWEGEVSNQVYPHTKQTPESLKVLQGQLCPCGLW